MQRDCTQDCWCKMKKDKLLFKLGDRVQVKKVTLGHTSGYPATIVNTCLNHHCQGDEGDEKDNWYIIRFDYPVEFTVYRPEFNPPEIERFIKSGRCLECILELIPDGD